MERVQRTAAEDPLNHSLVELLQRGSSLSALSSRIIIWKCGKPFSLFLLLVLLAADHEYHYHNWNNKLNFDIKSRWQQGRQIKVKSWDMLTTQIDENKTLKAWSNTQTVRISILWMDYGSVMLAVRNGTTLIPKKLWNKRQSLANCVYWERFCEVFLSPWSNILYTIMCWTSTHPCLWTTEPFRDAPFIPNHDTLTCYQWSCLTVESSKQVTFPVFFCPCPNFFKKCCRHQIQILRPRIKC